MCVLASLATVLALVPPSARADIVECRDAHGVLLLSPAGADSACRDRSAAPAARRAQAAAMPSSTVASPTSFPRVDPSTQRQRDGDRGFILRSELESEQARATQLETDLSKPRAAVDRSALGDVVAQLARTRQNVLAIQREISGLR